MAGCHNCAAAKKVLNKIIADYPNLNVEEIDMRTPKGQELVQKYTIMASPGIIIDNELFSTGGLDEKKLREKLKK
jgi:glutaredoxin